MMGRRFSRFATAGVLALGVALTGCAGGDTGAKSGGESGDKGAIAVSFAGLDIQIWVDMLDMIEPQIEAAGYEFLSDDPQWNIQNQVSDWQSWIVRGDLRALMGAPVQTDSMFAVTQEANAAGVPVLGYSTEWDGVEAALLIDNYEDGVTLGKAAGEWIVEHYGSEKIPVFLYSNYETDLGIDRSEGVKDGLAEAGAKLDFSESSTLSVKDSYDAAVNQLTANPETKVWLGTGSDQMIGAYRALMDHGVSADDEGYALGALDATNESLDIIEEPDSIWRFAYVLPASELADRMVDLLLRAADGQKVDNEHVASSRITAENVDDFRVSQ